MGKFRYLFLAVIISGGIAMPGCLNTEDSPGGPELAEGKNYGIVLGNLHREVFEVYKSEPDTTVMSDLAKFTTGGKFTDIDYDIYLDQVAILKDSFTNDQKVTSSNHSRSRAKHLERLTKMAVAYSNSASSYYHDAALKTKIIEGVEYWITLNPDCLNWWWRMIGFPKRLQQFASVMGSDLESSHPQLVQKIANYLLWSWSSDGKSQVGANGTDVARVVFTGAILAKNDTIAKEVMQKVSDLFIIQDTGSEEGIQVDYSFNQHGGTGRQLYLAHYGKDYFSAIMHFFRATSGTSYFFNSSKVKLLEDMYLEGISWIIYEGYYDENQTGRFIGLEDPADYVKWLQELIGMDTPQKNKLEDISQWLQNGNTSSYNLSGNRMFWRHDYMIHRRENYFTSVRMTSTRTVGNSAGNGKGLNNIHTGDGVNYIRVYGDEYQGLMPDNSSYNWKKIAGITAEQHSNKLLAPIWGKGGAGGDKFAGGVSDGTYGATGFVLKRDNVSAKKSWFFFDDYYVALGADIQAPSASSDVVTTVNQTSNKSTVQKGMSGSEIEWLIHGKIGYYFDNYTGSVELTDSNIMTLGINHGSSLSDGEYAYAVYPDTTESTLNNNITNKPYVIVSNTNKIQSVANSDYSIVYIVFYEPGSLNVNSRLRIDSDNKAVVMLKKISGNGYDVSLADPLCELGSASTITLTINGKNLDFSLPTGDAYRGQTVSKKTTVPAQVPTYYNILLNKTIVSSKAAKSNGQDATKNNSANLVNDGDTNTQWETWSAAISGEIVFDLGKVMPFHNVTIYTGTPKRDFQNISVQASDDGSIFTVLKDLSQGSGDIAIDFTEVSKRYLKITFDVVPTVSGGTSYYGFGIKEIELKSYTQPPTS